MMGAFTALPALAIDAYLPALPRLTADLSTTPATAQLTLTAVLVGLALGQLLVGPLSDSLGRRRRCWSGSARSRSPVPCAPSRRRPARWSACGSSRAWPAAPVLVLTRAIVRDRYSGAAAARVFASLMLVMGVVPVVAPVLGAQLLRFTSWRGIFLGLTGVALVLLAVGVRALPETLPLERRHASGLPTTLRAFGMLLRDLRYVGYVLASSLIMAGLFAYIAGSPFVLQNVYGLSAQEFSVVFAGIAAGLIALSQVGARVVARTGPRPLMFGGLAMAVVGGMGVLVVVLLDLPLAVLLPALFLSVASVGLVGPNATALALADHGAHAGSASALLGSAAVRAGRCRGADRGARRSGRRAAHGRGAGGPAAGRGQHRAHADASGERGARGGSRARLGLAGRAGDWRCPSGNDAAHEQRDHGHQQRRQNPQRSGSASSPMSGGPARNAV
jgi:DHA1 family bicyclomycin/chloramphenicol resistance-like MFS transporter